MLLDFKDYLYKQGKSQNTIKSYCYHIEGYMKWYIGSFGEELKKLYRQNILEYKSFLLNIKKDNARTINAKLSSISKFNEYLMEKNIQNDVVISRKDKVNIQQQYASPAAVAKAEVEKFRQKVLEFEGIRNYCIVTIMAYGGLRISEVLNLNINDVNTISKEIIVVGGKGAKQRIVYMNSKIIESINEYLKLRKNEVSKFLFISNKGLRLDRTVINKMFKKYSKVITPHSLRHFYCSNALECGYSVHEVANQAGHSNIHTTLLYTNPTKERMKSKAELL